MKQEPQDSRHNMRMIYEQLKVLSAIQTIAKPNVGSSLSYKEKFELANDFRFSEACLNAWDKKPPLRENPFQTIGDRIVLIQELEKQGFKIVRVL